jgi:hypothetical protein
MKTDTIMRRSFWLALIDQEWQRPILWLSGVRRAGKTFLCKSIHRMEYFDCELPRMRRLMEDPEGFLDSVKAVVSFWMKSIVSIIHLSY